MTSKETDEQRGERESKVIWSVLGAGGLSFVLHLAIRCAWSWLIVYFGDAPGSLASDTVEQSNAWVLGSSVAISVIVAVVVGRNINGVLTPPRYELNWFVQFTSPVLLGCVAYFVLAGMLIFATV